MTTNTTIKSIMDKRVGELTPRELAHVLRRMGITADTFAKLADNQVSAAGRVDESAEDRHERRNLSAGST